MIYDVPSRSGLSQMDEPSGKTRASSALHGKACRGGGRMDAGRCGTGTCSEEVSALDFFTRGAAGAVSYGAFEDDEDSTKLR